MNADNTFIMYTIIKIKIHSSCEIEYFVPVPGMYRTILYIVRTHSYNIMYSTYLRTVQMLGRYRLCGTHRNHLNSMRNVPRVVGEAITLGPVSVRAA